MHAATKGVCASVLTGMLFAGCGGGHPLSAGLVPLAVMVASFIGLVVAALAEDPDAEKK